VQPTGISISLGDVLGWGASKAKELTGCYVNRNVNSEDPEDPKACVFSVLGSLPILCQLCTVMTCSKWGREDLRPLLNPTAKTGFSQYGPHST